MQLKTEGIGLFLYTESALHAGTGSTLSDIDLPIQRATHTRHPIVYASGIKGALRDLATQTSRQMNGREQYVLDDVHQAVFGPESEDASEHGGLGIFQEGRLVLFPVACFDGIFRWVTSPSVLHRLRRDFLTFAEILDDRSRAAVTAFINLDLNFGNLAITDGFFRGAHTLDLHDFRIAKANAEDHLIKDLSAWFSRHAFPESGEYAFWREHVESALVVVSEGLYTHLVNMATHIEAHVKIGNHGVVESGPWMEESLPPDSLLWTSIVFPPSLGGEIRRKLGQNAASTVLRSLIAGTPRFRLGGGRSTGMGLVYAREVGR